MAWLKNPEHRNRKKVESDKNLTKEQREILKGIHKRNCRNVDRPSAQDLDFLQQLYGISRSTNCIAMHMYVSNNAMMSTFFAAPSRPTSPWPPAAAGVPSEGEST